MQNWLSIHFYPNETEDIFLQRAVRPFLEKYIWPEKTARAFFVRFEDERGEHIRLRIRGEAEFLENQIRPAISEHFEGRGERFEEKYQPETNRFGGEEAMAWAEEHFHQSTRVVLDRSKTEKYGYEDAMFDALRMHIISVFAAGFDLKKVKWYFEKLTDQWLPLFFQPENPAAKNWEDDVKTDFSKKLKRQRREIVDALDKLWTDLKKGKIDKSQPEWLRWLRANELILKSLDQNLEKALPSLIHLTNNRLGIKNHHEVYLNFILTKVF